MANARYEIIETSEKRVVIKDLGPWDKHLTVTNDADDVVKRVYPCLNGRKLFCIDSDGNEDELLVSKEGKFAGFA